MPDNTTGHRGAMRLTLVCVMLAVAAPVRGDWPTHRANPARTGNVDGKPGPKNPKVIWVYRSQTHFVASPVPGEKCIYVAGVGAFNTGVLHALSTEPAAPKRAVWSKASPYVKRPTVCAPVSAGGLIVFGDGMHQTDGAVLYCLQAPAGRPLWQLSMPGKDIRLECSPTLDRGRVFFGGGGAGVLAVNAGRVALGPKQMDLTAAKALIEKRRAELFAKYEQQKKKDPEFAIPPGDDALPKLAPKIIWQRGKGKWYVGAPVAVAGDRVLVASQYLDDEKIGKRSLFCLKAADGKVLWETPLKVNPWAGPTVAGDAVLVGCSSIRFDAGKVKGAAGEVVAIGLADGRIRWRKPVPGAVLASIAVKDGLAVFTATDGKVRAWTVAAGDPKWVYDAASPFFAGPAVAGGVVYAADIKAVVHAVRLADGRKQWSLDVTDDPAAMGAGAVFGSPVVHGGRIYLATCDLEGKGGGPRAVVCVGDASEAVAAVAAKPIVVDKVGRTITIPCRIAPRKLPTLKAVYPIEVIASYPHPRGQKAHETVITIESTPSKVHQALVGLGLKPGTPAKGHGGIATGPEVSIALQIPGLAGSGPRVIPIEKALLDARTGRPLPRLTWRFTGSIIKRPDPDKPRRIYGADLSGTLIALFPVTDETVFQANLTMAEEALLKVETNKAVLPPEGVEAKLVIRLLADPRLGGTGFRDVPLRQAAPFAPGPQPWPASTLVPVPDTAWLPPVDLFEKPRVVSPAPVAPKAPASKGGQLPVPAAKPDPLPAGQDRLPTGPPARSAAPNPDRLGSMPMTRPRDLNRIGLAGDPTEAPARQMLLSTRPGLREKPAPFLRLSMPDPFETLKIFALPKPPLDDDPPAAAAELPPPLKQIAPATQPRKKAHAAPARPPERWVGRTRRRNQTRPSRRQQRRRPALDRPEPT